MFEYWHGYRDGTLTRDELRARMAQVQQHFEATLHRAVAAGIERLSGSCKEGKRKELGVSVALV